MHTTSPIKIATAITAAARRVQRRIATLASFPLAAEDSDRWAAEGDEIEHTTVDTCDACEGTTQVRVVGPNGGVLALCVDSAACTERQRSTRRRHRAHAS